MKRLGVILAVVVLGAGAIAFVAVRASLPVIEGEYALPGLGSALLVERDALGVVTVRGASRLDVARATGFAHAQDRYFQMDLYRRAAAGELAALFGAAAADYDAATRLHALRPVAQAAAASMQGTELALIEAYTGGVNAGLASLSLPPPEYWLLRERPVPWQPADTLLVIAAMSLRLSDPLARYEMRVRRLHDCLPASAASFLSADDARWAATLDGSELGSVRLPTPADFDLRNLTGVIFETTRTVGESVLADPDLPGGASNAWAVSGPRSSGAGALVANDMHLNLALPNAWYRMRLIVAGDQAPLDVTGVTLPGTPAVAAGSNGRVAWGLTNSYGDWSDRLPLNLDPDDPRRYRLGERYVPFEVREARIEVRGAPPRWASIDQTPLGPVVTDWRGRRFALRWTGQRAGAIDLGLLALERASSVDEALDIAAVAGMPPQNIVVGDHHGRIGWSIAGRIPRRLDDGRWGDWLPADAYPRVVDPPDGYLWSANHRHVSAQALAIIGNGGFWHGARASRIRDELAARAPVSEADMLALQLDDRAPLLDNWQAMLLDILAAAQLRAHPRADEFRAVVATHTGRASADSAAYRLVHAFRARVRDVVFAAFTAPCRNIDPDYQFEGFRQYEGPLRQLLSERPAHLLNPGFESWDALLESVAADVIDYFSENFEGPFSERRWGEHNTVAVTHPLSRAVPALATLLDMPAQPMSGDRHVPLMVTPGNAASERFVVAPGRESEGYFHMPGGQSGNPFSRFYRRGHEAWLTGAKTPFLPGKTQYVLRLQP